MNRLITILATALSLLAAPSRPAAAQTGSDLFQQALRKERVDGDLKGAIALYQRILKEHSSERALNASVLLQLGAAYEKQGNTEARTAYQRVVREFGEQTDQVARARSRLDALTSNLAEPGGPTLRRVGSNAPGAVAASADGQTFSFVDRRTGRLGVRDQATGETRMLTDNPQRAWQTYVLGNVPSRDGKSVAYTWYSEQHPVELRLISSRGGEPRVLVSNPSIEFIAPVDWSSDGKQILAFTVRKGGNGQIAIISAVDGGIRVLKTFGWRVFPGRFGFSPDGKFIAYNFATRDESEARDILVIATDASTEAVFAGTSEDEQFLAWTPDGTKILYASGPSEQRSIWLAGVASGKRVGEPTLVRREAEKVEPVGMTDRGTFLFSAVAPSPIRAYSVALDSGTRIAASAAPVKVSRAEAWAAQWSHDGQTLAYASQAQPDDSRPTHVIVRSELNGTERVVPAVDLAYAYSTRWSPDDRYLMIVGQDKKGRRGVFRVDPSSGTTTLVIAAAGGADDVFAGWTADAKSVIYTENGRGESGSTTIVHQRDLQTGDDRELARLAGISVSSPKVSPDLKRLAFIARDAGKTAVKSLKVLDLIGGGLTNIVTVAPGAELGPFAWSSDGHSFYYAMSAPDEGGTPNEAAKSRLMRIPAAGGDAIQTGIVIPRGTLSLQSSRNGETLLFTALGSAPGQRDVWAMESFLPKAQRESSGGRR
jgi:Tol biopolymer transport system component